MCMFVYHLFLPVFYVCMYVYILSYFVNKLEIWWLYLSPIEKRFFISRGSDACPGIRKGGGPKSESLFFFFCFSIFQGGGGPSSENS